MTEQVTKEIYQQRAAKSKRFNRMASELQQLYKHLDFQDCVQALIKSDGDKAQALATLLEGLNIQSYQVYFPLII